MKPSELLASARDELSDGWTRGAWRNSEGVCMIGALDRATMSNLHQGGIRARKPAEEALLNKCKELFGNHVSIPSVNDSRVADKQEVLDLLDKTIIGLEEVSR